MRAGRPLGASRGRTRGGPSDSRPHGPRSLHRPREERGKGVHGVVLSSAGRCVHSGGIGEERRVGTLIIVEARPLRDVVRGLGAGQADYSAP